MERFMEQSSQRAMQGEGGSMAWHLIFQRKSVQLSFPMPVLANYPDSRSKEQRDTRHREKEGLHYRHTRTAPHAHTRTLLRACSVPSRWTVALPGVYLAVSTGLCNGGVCVWCDSAAAAFVLTQLKKRNLHACALA